MIDFVIVPHHEPDIYKFSLIMTKIIPKVPKLNVLWDYHNYAVLSSEVKF